LDSNEGIDFQYNRNVADQVFTRKNTVSTPVNVTDTYTYDHLSRMLQGQMAAAKGRETLVYDKGGNITSLTRTNADPYRTRCKQVRLCTLGYITIKMVFRSLTEV
jgi:hypothetical protein